MDKRLKKFTIADRLAILHEYETSDLTGAEIAKKVISLQPEKKANV